MVSLLDSKAILFYTTIITLFYTLAIQYPAFAQNENDSDTDSNEIEEQPNIIQDSNLKIEVVAQGLEFPTTMAFVGPDDILVSEKNTGNLKRIVDGDILEETLLHVNLAHENERGMLGIAVVNNTQNGTTHTYVFVYFTESKSSKDAADDCPPPEPYYCEQEKEPLGNRLYRYELVNNELSNPKLLLDLPATPGASHNGGVVLIGPDDNIYTAIGDVAQRNRSLAQNVENSKDPDGRGGILRVTQDGDTVGNGILGNTHPLNKYYAYGIRNSFGIDSDPLTGFLWDTENGPAYGDEINLVKPGFNSGWSKVQGIWTVPLGLKTLPSSYTDFKLEFAQKKPDNLVEFNGKGEYSPPEFTWVKPVGPTAIKFLATDKLGKEYKNDLFVGDVRGHIYHLDLNKDRTELVLTGKLSDKVADTSAEIDEADIIFGAGFGRITDIEVGPYDGDIYVVSNSEGKIFRIVPINDND